MALRSPLYLDIETLLAQAEHHDIFVPREMEIVEKTSKKRAAGGHFSVAGIGGGGGEVGSDVEYQSTFNLKPREKATVSKVIDKLILEGVVKSDPDENTPLSKDDLIELDGVTRITTASLAGKIFFMFRRWMDSIEGEWTDLQGLRIDDEHVADQIRQIYLRNELLPLPILTEITGTRLPQKVYVNVRPDHFIGSASANRLEGERRILGTVSSLVTDGDDGYSSAEEWLLHDWEYLLRRKLMTEIGDVVSRLAEQLEIVLPVDDVHAYIAGPALIVDAIALY